MADTIDLKMKLFKPFTIPNLGPIPKIELEEGKPPGAFDHLIQTDDFRKYLRRWYVGLPWHERLNAHHTMNSFRRHVALKRPFADQHEIDFVLHSVYNPLANLFAEKGDPYLQKETVFGEDVNLDLEERFKVEGPPFSSFDRRDPSLPKHIQPRMDMCGTWKVLRNRMPVVPARKVPRGAGLLRAEYTQRREHPYNVKLGIAADHSPQTNPGYSRTPSGSFYGI